MAPRAKVRPANDRPPDIPAFSLGRYHAKRPGLTWGVRCVSQMDPGYANARDAAERDRSQRRRRRFVARPQLRLSRRRGTRLLRAQALRRCTATGTRLPLPTISTSLASARASAGRRVVDLVRCASAASGLGVAWNARGCDSLTAPPPAANEGLWGGIRRVRLCGSSVLLLGLASKGDRGAEDGAGWLGDRELDL
jgi:hypothetical protein